MKFISKFVTSKETPIHFKIFGSAHLYILFIALVFSILIYKRKNESRRLELFIGSVLIFQQIILYLWYFLSNFNPITQGLPLYHCRIAIIFIGLGLICNKKNLMKLGSYIGIFGSIGALLFPGLDPFTFPHITQFSFFIGHLFLLWGSIYLLTVKKVGMSKSDLKESIIFANTYHILMFILNNIIHSNYGYMSAPPFHIEFYLPHLVYGFIVIMIFNAVLFAEYIFINKLSIHIEDDHEYNIAH